MTLFDDAARRLDFDDAARRLHFTDTEPGVGQRWSTWPAISPSERGPRPWPDWVVTSAGAIDTELGIVKTGKEADVFLIERGMEGDPSKTCRLAAKRYRGSETSDFHRSSVYREGRRLRRSRDARAVATGTRYGRTVTADRWAYSEFEGLCRLYERGVPVPYPVQVNGTELLMEFIGDGANAAPRLAQIRPDRARLSDYFEQVAQLMRAFARAGAAHGDLSAYNLLVHHDRLVVIDLPQLVDISSNPAGMQLLWRDCHNVCEWFARKGLALDEAKVFATVVAEVC